MKRERLIVIGPLPPPIHGVTISTTLVLANQSLCRRFDVEHLDTSDQRSIRNVGRWDIINTLGALATMIRLLVRLQGRKGVVYLPLSQSTPGFLRDSILVLLASAWRWRVAAHLRGSDFRSYYDASPALLQRWIRFILQRIDSIAVMGTSLRWVFRGLVSDGSVTVVPNGSPEPRQVDVPRDPHHVLFLSNLRRRKGIVQAVEAAVLVREQFPSAHFTFAGNWECDELEAELKELARQFDGTLNFRSAVDGEEKDRLLASAGIFLFPPPDPEGHPRVVLEALAAGLPVVTTDRGAIRETVIDGKTGYVLPHPDPRLLAERILGLLRDPELHESMCKFARVRYLEHFTQEIADRNLTSWLIDVSRPSIVTR